jgi:hypothetical protein
MCCAFSQGEGLCQFYIDAIFSIVYIPSCLSYFSNSQNISIFCYYYIFYDDLCLVIIDVRFVIALWHQESQS